MDRLIITLDGPAGSGKSTVAHCLAQRLGMTFLDTGAMYRAIAATCLDSGINPATQPEAVRTLACRCRLRFDWNVDPPRLYVGASGGDRDISPRLRDQDVAVSVSDVASMPEVRRELVKRQRQIAVDCMRLVTEGRDQGSVVFPDAQVKFFLDADLPVRARRRAKQTQGDGGDQNEQAVLNQLRRRDWRDQTRPDGPLICPEAAIRIDTTDMTIDQVVQRLTRLVEERAPGASKGGCSC